MNSPVPITLESADHLLAIVSLGSNLDSRVGDSSATLKAGLKALQLATSSTLIHSSLYRTEPIDCPPDSPDFVNAIALLSLPLRSSPLEFLRILKRIEVDLGRHSDSTPNRPRTLDLDLICFGNQCHADGELVLPHPRAWQRRFVLEPLVEVAPDLRLPDQELTPRQLLSRLEDGQASDRR